MCLLTRVWVCVYTASPCHALFEWPWVGDTLCEWPVFISVFNLHPPNREWPEGVAVITCRQRPVCLTVFTLHPANIEWSERGWGWLPAVSDRFVCLCLHYILLTGSDQKGVGVITCRQWPVCLSVFILHPPNREWSERGWGLLPAVHDRFVCLSLPLALSLPFSLPLSLSLSH